MFVASEILFVAFTRDTPPYPLSMDGGTDGGSTEQTAMRPGLDGIPSYYINIFSFVTCRVRRGGEGLLDAPGTSSTRTRTGTASTIPITVIKGIVDNLAVCFMVFPRVFLCLLPVFVLSCGQNTVILSIYSQKYHHFSISRAFFACSASAITRLLVTFPTVCGVSCH